jgi:hypothetical protein
MGERVMTRSLPADGAERHSAAKWQTERLPDDQVFECE